MRKILLSILTISLVASVVFGATQAWFTDSGEILGNQVTTGKLEVEVTPDTFTVTNIEPAPAEGKSYVSAGKFAVKNIGDYDMKWQGKLNVTAGGNNMFDYLWVRADMLKHGPQWVGGAWVNCNYGPLLGDTLFSGVPLNELRDYSYGHILMDDPTYAFGPGYTACYEIFVRMDPATPNSVQGRILSADLLIEATQRLNPGWTQ